MLKYSKEKVFDNIKVNETIFKLVIKGRFSGIPGQFYMLRGWGREPLLARPISIHNIDADSVEFMYQVTGEGTRLLSMLKAGEEIDITGPMGNGFDTENIKGRVAVVAGGIGTAPMNCVIKNLKHCDVTAFYGFRSSLFCIDDIKDKVKELRISTEDGSYGHKGFVTDLLEPENFDVVLCCGPEIMMNKVIEMCRDKNIPVYVTLEKHMACGIGACLVCTCKTKDGNKRTCKDGPVFNGYDLL